MPQQADTPRVGSESDFNVEQRRWALGYAGVSIVPTGAGSITVPAVGLRYWAESEHRRSTSRWGLVGPDGSTETAGMSTDKNAVFGILVQGGVPFVLAAHRHVNFEVIPYLTLGYGRTSTGMTAMGTRPRPTSTGSASTSGRAPASRCSSGSSAFQSWRSRPRSALSSNTSGMAQSTGGVDASDTTLSISTTVQNNPWDIFTGNVAARYYF